MHLPTYLATTLALIGISSALPTATADAEPDAAALVPRACTTVGPSHINVLQRSDPNRPHRGNTFNLTRSGGSNQAISVVTFANIPAGATGCMLRFDLPRLERPNQIASGEAIQSDVWSVAPDPNGVSTWNNPPARDQFVATTRFPTGTTESAFSTYLASNTCSPTMSFLFELSSWQQGAGSVVFDNNPGYLGFSMVFNC